MDRELVAGELLSVASIPLVIQRVAGESAAFLMVDIPQRSLGPSMFKDETRDGRTMLHQVQQRTLFKKALLCMEICCSLSVSVSDMRIW